MSSSVLCYFPIIDCHSPLYTIADTGWRVLAVNSSFQSRQLEKPESISLWLILEYTRQGRTVGGLYCVGTIKVSRGWNVLRAVFPLLSLFSWEIESMWYGLFVISIHDSSPWKVHVSFPMIPVFNRHWEASPYREDGSIWQRRDGFLVRLSPVCLRHPNQPWMRLMNIKDENRFHTTQHSKFQGGGSRAHPALRKPPILFSYNLGMHCLSQHYLSSFGSGVLIE